MKKRKLFLISLLLVLTLTACGGGSDDAPVSMDAYESDAVEVKYPKDWKDSSLEMFGMTIGIFSPLELGQEALEGLGDPFALMEEDPLVMLLVVPQDIAADMDLNIEEMMEDTVPEDDSVNLIREGDITISGADGREIVAKGAMDELGGETVGMHVAVALTDDGTAIMFVGMTPENNLDQNMDIFDYMVKSIDLK